MKNRGSLTDNPDDVSARWWAERWEPQVGRETGRFYPLVLPTTSSSRVCEWCFWKTWGSFRNSRLLSLITKWSTTPANPYQELWELKQATPYSLKVSDACMSWATCGCNRKNDLKEQHRWWALGFPQFK